MAIIDASGINSKNIYLAMGDSSYNNVLLFDLNNTSYLNSSWTRNKIWVKARSYTSYGRYVEFEVNLYGDFPSYGPYMSNSAYINGFDTSIAINGRSIGTIEVKDMYMRYRTVYYGTPYSIESKLLSGDDTITATDIGDVVYALGGADYINGKNGNDKLYGGSGNDYIEGGLGNDTINGGNGNDTAIFNYDYSNYTVDKSDFVIITSSKEGTDTLTGIELAQFADKTIGIDYSNPISGYNYLLTNIKDYGGTLHGGSESEQEINYYYQGSLDVAGDGTIEDIYTNKISKRWATVRRNSSTNNVDWSDHGKDGGTRIVGIYIDPLVTSGDVVQFSDHDSQYRFQNDLKIDNLLVKTAGDYDSDGIQEVYWKTADGTSYLRSLMHDDGNIRYANYQSETQMSEYLKSNSHESIISEIIS